MIRGHMTQSCLRHRSLPLMPAAPALLPSCALSRPFPVPSQDERDCRALWGGPRSSKYVAQDNLIDAHASPPQQPGTDTEPGSGSEKVGEAEASGAAAEAEGEAQAEGVGLSVGRSVGRSVIFRQDPGHLQEQQPRQHRRAGRWRRRNLDRAGASAELAAAPAVSGGGGVVHGGVQIMHEDLMDYFDFWDRKRRWRAATHPRHASFSLAAVSSYFIACIR